MPVARLRYQASLGNTYLNVNWEWVLVLCSYIDMGYQDITGRVKNQVARTNEEIHTPITADHKRR